MKKIIAILLMLTLALSLAACEKEPIHYEDHFEYQTPEDKADQTQYTLERNDFQQHIESLLNIHAYPDILIYNSAATEVVGMYIYDPETGLATGWTDLITGEVTTYEQGKEVDLGKPDPEKMVKFQGTVNIGAVVFEKESKATGAELYFFLTDAQDAATLERFMLDYYKEVLVKETDTLYKVVKDQDAITAEFAAEAKMGNEFYNYNAADYITLLQGNYGLTPVAE